MSTEVKNPEPEVKGGAVKIEHTHTQEVKLEMLFFLMKTATRPTRVTVGNVGPDRVSRRASHSS